MRKGLASLLAYFVLSSAGSLLAQDQGRSPGALILPPLMKGQWQNDLGYPKGPISLTIERQDGNRVFGRVTYTGSKCTVFDGPIEGEYDGTKLSLDNAKVLRRFSDCEIKLELVWTEAKKEFGGRYTADQRHTGTVTLRP